MNKLKNSFSAFDKTLAKEEMLIPAEMGIILNGKAVTLVPNREPFVYVKIRTNPSEVIEAYNNKVSPSYKLPVLIKREGNRYIVVQVDNARYTNWNSENPYLPRHGHTHIFDKDGGRVGSDPVFVYPYQFMPSLVSPFGVNGAENVYIQATPLLQSDGSWKYVGNTGTPSLTQYNPTSSGTSLLLISLDTFTGNPSLLLVSGTFISTSVSGTPELLSYLPSIDPSQYIPLSMVRLVSGTSTITWNNLTDVRQFFTPYGSSTILTGSFGGGHIIEDNGFPLTQRASLNFIGFMVSDDAGNDTTIIQATGTSGVGGGVESVTGDGVDNTDPLNPVLTFPVADDVIVDSSGFSGNLDPSIDDVQKLADAVDALTVSVALDYDQIHADIG